MSDKYPAGTIMARQITPEYERLFNAKLYRIGRGHEYVLLCDRCATGALAPIVRRARFLERWLKLKGRCKYAGWEHE